jgi:hypothetical protein
MADWDGTYTESYRISSDLKASSEHQDLPSEEKEALMTRSIQELLGHANPEKSSERKEALTKALAFAHSRGIGALLEFGIESDGGAENPQIQGLSLNQGGGGLPSKVSTGIEVQFLLVVSNSLISLGCIGVLQGETYSRPIHFCCYRYPLRPVRAQGEEVSFLGFPLAQTSSSGTRS